MRATSGLISPRLQWASQTGDVSDEPDEWQGGDVWSAWSIPAAWALAIAMLAKVQAGWLARSSCDHNSATIAKSASGVRRRWRRNFFIVRERYRFWHGGRLT